MRYIQFDWVRLICRLRTILSIGGGQIVALGRLECRMANAEWRTAAAAAAIVGASRWQILMCGAAKCWRLRWRPVVGMSRRYLICGDACNKIQKCVCVVVCVCVCVSEQACGKVKTNRNRLKHARHGQKPGIGRAARENESGKMLQGSTHGTICNCYGQLVGCWQLAVGSIGSRLFLFEQLVKPFNVMLRAI